MKVSMKSGDSHRETITFDKNVNKNHNKSAHSVSERVYIIESKAGRERTGNPIRTVS